MEAAMKARRDRIHDRLDDCLLVAVFIPVLS